VPHSYSLKLKKDFEYLFRSGRRFNSPHFTVVVAPSKKFSIAFVISKKTAQHATDRNYSKRIMRAIIHPQLITLGETKISIAIIAKSNLKKLQSTIHYNTFVQEIETLLKQASIHHEK